MIVLGVCLGYLAFIVYGPSYFTTILFTTIAGQLLTFMVVAVAGIAFPWRRRALVRELPIARSLGGLPVIALVGAAALAVYGFFFYSLLTTDALGANSSTGQVGDGLHRSRQRLDLSDLVRDKPAAGNRSRHHLQGASAGVDLEAMALFGRKPRGTRIFFATDIHGFGAVFSQVAERCQCLRSRRPDSGRRHHGEGARTARKQQRLLDG